LAESSLAVEAIRDDLLGPDDVEALRAREPLPCLHHFLGLFLRLASRIKLEFSLLLLLLVSNCCDRILVLLRCILLVVTLCYCRLNGVPLRSLIFSLSIALVAINTFILIFLGGFFVAGFLIFLGKLIRCCVFQRIKRGPLDPVLQLEQILTSILLQYFDSAQAFGSLMLDELIEFIIAELRKFRFVLFPLLLLIVLRSEAIPRTLLDLSHILTINLCDLRLQVKCEVFPGPLLNEVVERIVIHFLD
jgi:hypothetical protein